MVRLQSDQRLVGSNPQPEIKTKKAATRATSFCFGSDCRIILATLVSLRSSPIGDRRTPVRLSLVVEPAERRPRLLVGSNPVGI